MDRSAPEEAAAPDPGQPSSPHERRVTVIGAVVLSGLLLLAVGLVGLVALTGTSPSADATVEATASGAPETYAYDPPVDAPPLELTDQDGQPFALTSLRGRPVLVYFGYTHCPDVCPTSIGVMNEALAAAGPGPRAVFVSIDPDRDDVTAMKSYVRYLPPVYYGLSGTPQEIRRAADGWGVQYAKIETGSAGGYAMGHSSNVYLVDAGGKVRAAFPFGIEAPPVTAALQGLLAEVPPPSEPPATPLTAAATPPASARPTPAPATAAPATSAPATAGPGTGLPLYPKLTTTSIWTGGASPVIVTARDAQGLPLDERATVRVRVASLDGVPVGPEVPTVAVRPPGQDTVSFVGLIDVPSTGRWRLDVIDGNDATGSLEFTADDPGATPRLGGPAPDRATPTLDDVGGIPLAVTTVLDPDLRLSRTSTAEARASGRPYVLLIDSARFETTPACGRALTIVQYLVDRWPDVTFIHLEPYEYSIVGGEPVLNGSLTDPPLNKHARDWGMGAQPWPPTDQPWMYVVDGSGVVRAKYRAIMGTDDVDVILAMLAEEADAAP
jgi:protein SCO1/2